MKRQRTLISVLALGLGLLLALAAGLALAQGPAPQGGAARMQGFTPGTVSYQGRVTVGGTPYNGTGYFKFAIVGSWGNTTWSNDGTMVGEPTAAVLLSVTGGLFSVALGDTSLSGMTQWLGYDVFPPECMLRVWFSSDGVHFTQLTPDRPFTAVPYAFLSDNAFMLDGHGAGDFAVSGHDHWGETRSGSGTGLTLNSSDGVALYGTSIAASGKPVFGAVVWGDSDSLSGVYGTSNSAAGVVGWSTSNDGVGGVSDSGNGVRGSSNSGAGIWASSISNDGIHVSSAGDDGVEVSSANFGVYVNSVNNDALLVNSAGRHGVSVGSAGDDGFRVSSAGTDGVYVGSADDDGLDIYDAGNAPTHTLPSQYLGETQDGIDIAGAKDLGLWVGYAGMSGVHVNNAGAYGVYVNNAGVDGVNVNNAGKDGFFVGESGDDGVQIGEEFAGHHYGASDDGIEIHDAGNAPTHTLPSDVGWGNTHDGIDIAGAKDFGVWIGHAGTGLHIHESRNNGIEMESVARVGVLVDEAGEKGFVVTDSHGDGLQIGYELFGLYHGAGDDGIEIWDAGNAPTHIMPEDTVYGDTKDGIDIAGAKDFGLWVGYAGMSGVHVNNAGAYGVHVESAGNDGIQVLEAGDDGIQVWEAGDDGIYIWEAGNDGIEIGNAEDFGLWVGYAGNSGVWVEAAEGIGVHANTLNQYGYWGFYTPDRVYAGTALASGGPLMLVAQNGDGRNLEAGDVVAVSGMGAPFADGDSPVPLVQKTGQANSAAVGVVYRRFVAEEKVEEVEHDGKVERQTSIHTSSTEGPIAPGEYLLIVVLGPAQVKADASLGSIRPGDLLAASDNGGQAMKAEPVKVSGVEFYLPGTIIGKAMEPLEKGTGVIWVLVTLQ